MTYWWHAIYYYSRKEKETHTKNGCRELWWRTGEKGFTMLNANCRWWYVCYVVKLWRLVAHARWRAKGTRRGRERENPIDYSRASVKEKRWKVERKFHLLERETYSACTERWFYGPERSSEGLEMGLSTESEIKRLYWNVCVHTSKP